MNKANIFMTASWAGLACVAGYLLADLAIGSDGLAKTFAYLTIVSCWVMLFTRKADEYTQGLWTAAASTAFATLLVLFVGLPAIEGFYDGVRTSLENRDDDFYQQDIKAEAVVSISIAAFFVGLFWKRVRGGM